ncbi:MAG TPA: hypothetical protein VGG44_10685 [Tepidisphaeraceae bacterium]|jgi:hypothetical protein
MRLALRPIIALCVGLAAITITCPARADQVDNPHYQVWAKFKPGSSRAWTGSMRAGPVLIHIQMTSTLREVTPDHVVVETRTTTDFGQGPHAGRSLRETVDAKIEAEEVKDLGHETIQVMGRSFDCTVYQMKDDTVDGKERPWGGKAKIWVSPEVPGGVVKMDIDPQNKTPDDQNAIFTYELSAFDVK